MDSSRLPAALGIDPAPVEGAPARLSPGTLVQIAGDAFVAATALSLAIGESEGVFASDVWRAVLGATGALFAFVAVRALVRVAQGYRPRLDEDGRRRSRRKGKVFAALGLWLLALALVPAVSENAIALETWHKIGYGITGAMNLIVGLIVQWDPTKLLQAERVRSGDGLKGRARILRANDTGTSVNDAPQVKIDFILEVDDREPYEASDKIVVQQAKLALLIPGSTLGVTVDRVNPEVFHLDWDDWRAPSA